VSDIVERLLLANPTDIAPRLLSEAAAEIERLRTIVERLPLTADGARVYPGMALWWVPSWAIDDDDPPTPITALRVADASDTHAIQYDMDITCQQAVCYSTREASEAALAAGKGGG
jgi:hypothetical protein